MQRSQKILIGALLCCQLSALAPAADRTLDTEPVAPHTAERFDCENAFDLVAMMVVASCALYQPPPETSAAIGRASARLRETQLASAEELSQTSIAFCPLTAGTGMVPTPHQLYLDDGLLTMSADGLAEILAHELEHVQQFARLGTREFKCQYVRDMVACGGCQDRSHGLEAAAYARQDQARARLSSAAASR